MTPIETDLATMDSWISNIESLFTNGVTDIDFAMDRWATLTEKNLLKTDLAHRVQEDNIQSTTEDAQLKELYELIENDPVLGGKQPVVDPLVDPNTGEYIMGHAAIQGISRNSWGNGGSQELHPIEKTIAGLANYFVLDDLKTLTNPLSESSVPEKLWAGFSLLPAGRILGFGVDGVKLVRRSVSGKIVNPIKITPERIVQITKAAVKVKHSVTALNKTVKITNKFTKKVTVKLATNTLNNIAKIEKKLTGKVKSKAGLNGSKKTKVDDFDTTTATNKQKGNYGEIISSDNILNNRSLKEAGYDLKPIGRGAPSSIDDKIVHGIDGLYENTNPNSPIKYVIDEAKFGSSQLSKKPKEGPQMSDGWLIGEETGKSRIKKAVDGNQELADKITDALEVGQVERVLSKVDRDGNVKTLRLDKDGNVIGGWP